MQAWSAGKGGVLAAGRLAVGAGLLWIFKVEEEVRSPTEEEEKRSQIESGRSRERRGPGLWPRGEGSFGGRRGAQGGGLVREGARDRASVQPVPALDHSELWGKPLRTRGPAPFYQLGPPTRGSLAGWRAPRPRGRKRRTPRGLASPQAPLPAGLVTVLTSRGCCYGTM